MGFINQLLRFGGPTYPHIVRTDHIGGYRWCDWTFHRNCVFDVRFISSILQTQDIFFPKHPSRYNGKYTEDVIFWMWVVLSDCRIHLNVSFYIISCMVMNGMAVSYGIANPMINHSNDWWDKKMEHAIFVWWIHGSKLGSKSGHDSSL